MSREARQELVQALNGAIRRNQNAQDAFDDAVSRLLGINRTDLRCMDILDLDGPLTAGQLATRAGLSTGAVTTLLDRMERAGFVRRVRDTEDRRRVLVELTDEARRWDTDIWGPIAAEANEMFEDYSDDQLSWMLEFMTAGREFLDRHRARVEAMGGARGSAPTPKS